MFSKDVTDFELVGPVLKAKVRNHKGKMKSVKIDLNKYIGNNEGKGHHPRGRGASLFYI